MSSILKRTITLICFAVFTIVFYYQRRILQRYAKDLKAIRTADDKVVTTAFVGKFRHMANIALPSWTSKEGMKTMAFIGLFLIRSVLYVMGSHADGRIMELLLSVATGGGAGGKGRGGEANHTKKHLIRAVGFFAGIQLMQAAVGGAIEHIRHHLIASYRKILTRHFHEKFFEKLTYYHATAIDSRMEAADTVIPIYCGEFAEHFAELPYYFVMPFFDATVSLLEVVRQVGTRPAAGLVGLAGIFLAGLKVLTPPFGRIHALLLHREEAFKKKHTDVQTSVEQIALLNGGEVSKGRVNYSYDILMRSLEQMAVAKGFFKLLEDTAGGCCWELVGFLLSWSYVQSRRQQRLSGPPSSGRLIGGGIAADKLLSSMVVQRRLVADFKVAITAMVVNLREVSHLSEFTEKLAEFDKTLDSIARGEFARFVGSQQDDAVTTVGGTAVAGADGTALAGGGGGGAAAMSVNVIGADTSINLASSVVLNSNLQLTNAASSGRGGGNNPLTHESPSINNASFDSSIANSASPSRDHTADCLLQLVTTRQEADRLAAAKAEDAATVAAWKLPELQEAGWVPCIMSPALHHATYESTNNVHHHARGNSGIGGGDGSSSTGSGQEHSDDEEEEVVGETGDSARSAKSASSPKVVSKTHDPLVRFTNTDVCTPNGKLLIQLLNFTWEQGQSWAISGPNGCGKSSLLRVIAKTWLPSRGVVAFHDRVRFIYVPQTPYFPSDATLAEQVQYPDVPTLVPFDAALVVTTTTSTSAATTAGSATNKTTTKQSIRVQRRADANVVVSPSTCTSTTKPPLMKVTSLTASTAADHSLMVCPKEQRRMKEALLLATGRQLLAEVIGGWNSPVGGLYNPHKKFTASTTHLQNAIAAEAPPFDRQPNEKQRQNAVSIAEGNNTSKSENPNTSRPAPTPNEGSASSALESPSVFSPTTEVAGSPRSKTASSSASPVVTPITLNSSTTGMFSGCDRNLSWPSLSGGQQQKLSLARAFYQSLKLIEEGLIPIVVMDESTSQMDEASEDAVFKNLKSRHIDMLSVSHRKEVVLRHTHILQLARDPAAWRIVEVNENTVNEALEI